MSFVTWDEIVRQGGILRDVLEESTNRLVLAESCTAGMVATAISQWPGASNWLCGSAVVYQTATKNQWLNIDNRLLDDPAIGAVSQVVTDQLAKHVLERTPLATMSAAITGHLGPQAPAELDGVIFITVSFRRSMTPHEFIRQRTKLNVSGDDDVMLRQCRCLAATSCVLSLIAKCIKEQNQA